MTSPTGIEEKLQTPARVPPLQIIVFLQFAMIKKICYFLIVTEIGDYFSTFFDHSFSREGTLTPFAYRSLIHLYVVTKNLLLWGLL